MASVSNAYRRDFSVQFVEDNKDNFKDRLVDSEEVESLIQDSDENYLVGLVDPHDKERFVSLSDKIRVMVLNYIHPLSPSTWVRSKPIEAVARIYKKEGNVTLVKIDSAYYFAKGDRDAIFAAGSGMTTGATVAFRDYDCDHREVSILSPPRTLDNLMKPDTKVGFYQSKEEYEEDMVKAYQATKKFPFMHHKSPHFKRDKRVDTLSNCTLY